MQAIKEKLNDMGAMRKAKAEAKEEEKVEKEMAKARVEVAHEMRLAKEAEAARDFHVHKATEKIAEQERKLTHSIEVSYIKQNSFGSSTKPGDSYAYLDTTGTAAGPPTINKLL